MKYTHIHKPTGRPCRILSQHANGVVVVDLGPQASNSFPRTHLADLIPIPDDGPRQRRTDKLLARLRFAKTEYAQIHAVMCMSHGMSGDDYMVAESVFDGVRLAQRLDELNAQAQASFKASQTI